MPRACAICGKTASVGSKVSASGKRSKRRWQPNLQRVTALVNGARKKILVCTSCIRAGKVTKGG